MSAPRLQAKKPLAADPPLADSLEFAGIAPGMTSGGTIGLRGPVNAGECRTWLAADAPTYVIAVFLFALCLVLMAMKGIYFGPDLIAVNAQVFAISAMLMIAMDAGWQLWRHRVASPAAFLRDRYLQPDRLSRLLAGLPMLAVFICFMPFFSKMKAMIPLFNAYTWDQTFIGWDRALFFGHDAWQVLQPFVGYPPITAFLALLYQVWFLLLYPGCLFFCFFGVDDLTRRRFFLCFVLSWTVIGGALATAFASVGPCFLQPLLGDPHFAAQMAYLNAADGHIPVMTLTVQQLLLDWFHADSRGLGSGITAMPSMHISMAFLYYLAMRHVSKRAGSFVLVFLALIFVASVHLAYHYAVDGIVSIIVTAALWWSSKRVFAWWDRQRSTAAAPRSEPAIA